MWLVSYRQRLLLCLGIGIMELFLANETLGVRHTWMELLLELGSQLMQCFPGDFGFMSLGDTCDEKQLPRRIPTTFTPAIGECILFREHTRECGVLIIVICGI